MMLPGRHISTLIFAMGCALSCNEVLGLDDVSRKPSSTTHDAAGSGDMDAESVEMTTGGRGMPTALEPADAVAGAGGAENGLPPSSLDDGGSPGLCEDAGDSKDTAYDFGELETSEGCPANAYVDDDEPDFYHFVLRQNSVFSYTLSLKQGQLNGTLYKEAAQLVANDSISKKTATPPLLPADQEGATDVVNLEQGDYFLEVSAAVPVAFQLKLGADPYEGPNRIPEVASKLDDAADQAHELGEITDAVGSATSAPAALRVSGYVGKSDAVDYYRFETSSTVTLQFSLQDVKGEAMYEIYREGERDPQALWPGAWASPTATTFHEAPFAKGDYLLVIKPSPALPGSLYTLVVSIKQ